MRINCYRFPAGISDDIKVAAGCRVHLKSGGTCTPHCESIPDDKRPLIDWVEDTIDSLTVRQVKDYIKKYGGCGWSEFFERDGTLNSTVPIRLKGRNTYTTMAQAWTEGPGELIAMEDFSTGRLVRV